ncbi:MAG: glycosyltransferase [Desulfuromonadaceae bacterium]
MPVKLRIGIPLIGGKGWLGGVSYVENLIKALRMLPSDESPLLYLIVPPNMVEALELHRHLIPLVDGLYSLAENTALLPGVRNFNDRKDLGDAIDFLFPVNSDVVNELCSASWIPDFQHIYLPHLFSSNELITRDTAFARIAETAKLVVFSSKDAANDFSKLYPSSPAIMRILHFHTLSPEDMFEIKPIEIVKKYSLPDRFILCSNQFWLHKNHKLLFCALAELIKNSQRVHLVCTGATTDYRSADHFNNMLQLLQELNIQGYVHIMGTLPRNDQIQIMRHSLAVVQPSLFEGWSTVVEDARSLGKTVILSDLAVHYEQYPDHAYYFDRQSIDSLHKVLETVLPELQPGPDIANEKIACGRSAELAIEFARNFMAVAHEACENFITPSVEEGRSMTGVDGNSGRNCSRSIISIATSIALKNIEKQKSAVTSWFHQGFRVISVNTAPEIAILKSNFPDVIFVETQRDARETMGRPLIFLDDVLAALAAFGAPICGIINSDIHLDAKFELADCIAREAVSSLIIGHRIDVDKLGSTDGEVYLNGFDLFFFDRNLCDIVPPNDFCLGATWWDTWLPLIMLIKGIKVKQLMHPGAYHVKHDNRWDETECHANCSKTIKALSQPESGLAHYQNLLADANRQLNIPDYIGFFMVLRNFILNHVTKLDYPMLPIPGGGGSRMYEDTNSSTFSYLVSAIVSTYNAEAMLRDCLTNLLNQTLYQKGLLEIIIINSGSEQDEEKIVHYYMENHDHIVYQRTERETLYAAWNRAINLASGTYIVNANTDDTLRKDALELLASALDAYPEADLVYGDCALTREPNDSFTNHHAYHVSDYPLYNPALGMMFCLLGPHPMWRKALFNEIGMFDPSYRAAGDYEFQMRFIMAGRSAVHVPEVLSLFCQNAEGLSLASETSSREAVSIESNYRSIMPINRLYEFDSHSPASMADAWVAQGNLSLAWSCPWLEHAPPQLYYAASCYRKALEVDRKNKPALQNLCALMAVQSNWGMFEYLLECYTTENNTLKTHLSDKTRPDFVRVEVKPASKPLVFTMAPA